MAYQVDKFNGTPLVSVADGTIDTTTDLRFLGKNYAGYGEVQNENFLHLLESFANTTPPPKAINGQVWFDSATKRLKFYDQDNAKWRTTANIEVSESAPVKMNQGDLWYDKSADQLYAWNGNAYVLVGPQATLGGVQTATSITPLTGTDGLSYSVVRLLAGDGTTVAIVSNDEFTFNPSAPQNQSLEPPLSGFTLIKKGITLARTDSVTGITEGDGIFWGTSSVSLGILDSDGNIITGDQLVTSGASEFTNEVSFVNSGFTVGTPFKNLAVYIDQGDQPILESRNAAKITLRIRESDGTTTHDVMEFIAPTNVTSGAAIPGIDNTYNLGSQVFRWKNIYAAGVTSTFTGNLTGNTTGVHTGNVLASDATVAYNSQTKTFTGTFTGILTGNVQGDVSGNAGNAYSLNGQNNTTSNTPSSIVSRDSNSDIFVNEVHGTATRARALEVESGTFRVASSAPTANTIVVRDAAGNISANTINGTASAANALQVDGSVYRTASTSATGNTIVVRDASGNIAVNGIIGAANQAIQLQVDGTSYRVASISATANTIAVRDSDGILRATGIDNTPIGATTRSTGAFTTLSANGAVTFTSNTASTSSTTGALVVSGGLGVAGSINAGGEFKSASIQNTPIGSVTRSSGAFTTLTANGTTTLTANVASTSTETGTLVVTGGVGISGTINIGGAFNAASIQNTPIGSVTRNTGAFTTLSANAATTFTAGTASTSPTTGTVVVTGGMGISGNLYAGGIVNAGFPMYSNDNSITSSYTIPSNKNASSTGPITINNGVTITVSGNWSIV